MAKDYESSDILTVDELHASRHWHHNVNWAAIGVVVTIAMNVIVLVWHAATTANVNRAIAQSLEDVQRTSALTVTRQVSADSALVAALSGHEVRIVRLEERTGIGERQLPPSHPPVR